MSSSAGSRRLVTLTAAVLAAVAVTTGPAVAKGGGGGGSTPAPAPAPEPVDTCAGVEVPTSTDGSTAFATSMTAGCVVVRAGSALSLVQVVSHSGWTYVVTSNGGGTKGRVAVDFEQAATGRRASFLMEPGKTVIKN